MTIHFKAPENVILKPIITVFGIGGAGGNAVNNMISANLQGAKFAVANTDAQALEYSICDSKIQLGATATRGLGAGASPQVGAEAASESEEEIRRYLEGSNMLFIAAGMGGGTGTGASPVIAKIAKELDILTVGVVTKPFHFEGVHRMKTAEKGLIELQQFVDTLIVIPNQNLFRIANERTTFADAFKMADDVLHAGIRSITDLMTMPGLINLDFADIKTIMKAMGKAMMGTGESSGEDRAIKAAEAAISNPLLDHSSMQGAKGVLINITGGADMTLFEVDSAANRIRNEVGDTEANIIFGSTFNPDLSGVIRVSVVATGIDAGQIPIKQPSSITDKFDIHDVLEEFEQQTAKHEEELMIEELETTAATINAETESQAREERPYHAADPNESFNVRTKPVPNNNDKSSSIFSKMWNSLKSGNETRSTPTVEHFDNYRQINNTETDIQEVPAFLRKQQK